MKPGLLSFDDALAALMERAQAVEGVETVATTDASGRVLAQAQSSAINVPSADNTSMDGYAVRCADLTGEPSRLRIAQRIPAGHVGQPLEPGTAARIFTGAFVPAGADAVVMQEQTEADGDYVTVLHSPKPGEWIRRAGEDIQSGSVILPAGVMLTAQAVGLAASVGLASLQIGRAHV